jgi:hypothetical protein
VSAQNTQPVFLPFEIKMLLQDECAKNKQLPAQRILFILNEHFKDQLPKQVYEGNKTRYSMTAQESRQKKRDKAQVKQKRGNAKLKNELLRIRENLAYCDLNLKNPNTNNPRFFEQKKKSLEVRKGILEQLLKEDETPSEPLEAHKSGKIPKRRK